jgi:hypothetical protein
MPLSPLNGGSVTKRGNGVETKLVGGECGLLVTRYFVSALIFHLTGPESAL